jgi:hypothetical protein
LTVLTELLLKRIGKWRFRRSQSKHFKDLQQKRILKAEIGANTTLDE